MRKLIGWMVGTAVLLTAVGCVTKSTTTEGDRLVMDQTRQAADVAIAKVREGILAAGVVQGGPASIVFGAALAALNDVKANSEQQLAVHGAPKKSVPYTAEKSKEAREQSNKEHEGNTWFWPAMGIVASVGATLLGMPWLSRMFPALTGTVGKTAQACLQTITFARKKAEENGGSIGVTELLAIAKDENVLAGVQEIVAAKAKALEAKLGVNFTQVLNPPATPENPTT